MDDFSRKRLNSFCSDDDSGSPSEHFIVEDEVVLTAVVAVGAGFIFSL